MGVRRDFHMLSLNIVQDVSRLREYNLREQPPDLASLESLLIILSLQIGSSFG